MTPRMRARSCQLVEARPVAGFIAFTSKPRSKGVPRLDQFFPTAADRMRCHQVGRCLAKGTGGYLEPQGSDATFAVELHVRADPAAADWGALLRRAVRRLEPPKMRNARRQPQQASIVERRVHRTCAAGAAVRRRFTQSAMARLLASSKV